jgi:proline racemase
VAATGAETVVRIDTPAGLIEATLVGRGELSLGQPFVHQSVTGARFTGRTVESTWAAATPACRVAITGSTFITADATIYVDRADALAEGFQLG